MKKRIINFEIIKKYFPKLNSNSTNFKNLDKYINFISSKYNLKKNKSYFFKNIGKVIFPYTNLGKVESYDLIFNPNEFIVFYLYGLLKKINKRKFAADFGANLGLHSIILNKLGYNVEAYEPDPETFKKLKKNIKLNKLKNVKLKKYAVFSKSGQINFTRLNDNLTGSHIENLKKSYGSKKHFKVKMIDIKDLIHKFDLVKLDIESAEANVICRLNKKNFLNKDFIIEIGNLQNAKKIFNFLKKNRFSFYSQKSNFKKVKYFNQMPVSHKDGALIITQNFI